MQQKPLSRWQQFYLGDPNLANIQPSACANFAAKLFADANCRLILDLGCGTGRDTLQLASGGAHVLGLDAAHSGLLLAKERIAPSQNMPSWIESDACLLPFSDTSIDGVYCFGLLHEFVGESAKTDVARIMGEIYRVLRPLGLAIVAVSAGDPEKGLPQVQNFSEAMFDAATNNFHCVEKKTYADLGCTGRTDYKVWFGHLVKQ